MAVLFSVSFMSHESEHDCIGEECQICAIVGKVTETLENLFFAVVPIAILGAVFFGVTRVFGEKPFALDSETPVRLKVKLSD